MKIKTIKLRKLLPERFPSDCNKEIVYTPCGYEQEQEQEGKFQRTMGFLADTRFPSEALKEIASQEQEGKFQKTA